MRACHAEAWRRRVACKSKIVAAGTAASTEGTETAVPTSIAFLNFEGFREQAGGTRKSTEGNEGNEGFLLRNPNCIFVFFACSRKRSELPSVKIFLATAKSDAKTHRHACIAARSWCGHGTPNSESLREATLPAHGGQAVRN
jgi:hypothetical protein